MLKNVLNLEKISAFYNFVTLLAGAAFTVGSVAAEVSAEENVKEMSNGCEDQIWPKISNECLGNFENEDVRVIKLVYEKPS